MPEDVLLDASALHAATLDACRSIARLRALVGGEPSVLAVLAERIDALAGELAWETGLAETADQPETAGQLETGSGSGPAAERLDHVGIVVGDLAAAAALYGGVLKGRLVAGGVHREMQVRSLHYTFAGGSKIELLQPVGPGETADFLQARGGGLHHLTFFVPEVEATAGELTGRGYRVVHPAAQPGWREAYISPRSTQGCVIQLVTSPAGHTTEAVGVTVEQVLAGQWEWADHQARRV